MGFLLQWSQMCRVYYQQHPPASLHHKQTQCDATYSLYYYHHFLYLFSQRRRKTTLCTVWVLLVPGIIRKNIVYGVVTAQKRAHPNKLGKTIVNSKYLDNSPTFDFRSIRILCPRREHSPVPACTSWICGPGKTTFLRLSHLDGSTITCGEQVCAPHQTRTPDFFLSLSLSLSPTLSRFLSLSHSPSVRLGVSTFRLRERF